MESVSYRKRFSPLYTAKTKKDLTNRPFSVTGADAVLEPQGDLVVNKYGDIAVATGAECIIKGLLRRLGTPPSGYARYIKEPSGFIRVDPDYYNELYDYLSGPLTRNNLTSMQSALQTAAAKDGRVVVKEVKAADFQYASNSVELTIIYSVKSSSELSTMRLYIDTTGNAF